MSLIYQLVVGLLAALVASLVIVQFPLQDLPRIGIAVALAACAAPLCNALFGRAGGSGTEARGEREEGEVKWFSMNKGFGFIRRDNGEEIFVHYRSIRGENKGRRGLRDGQRVSFVVVDSDKGPQAEEVEGQ